MQEVETKAVEQSPKRGLCLQWAGECLPLPEKQSRWPGLLEELLKVFVGDKRDNELPPGSPGLFPNVIPWLCTLHPNTTEGILEELENAVTPSVEFLGNGKQQKQQEQSWKQAPARAGIQWDFHIPWRPQCSGKAERRKQSLKRQMSQICPKPPMATFPGIAEDFSQAPGKRLTSQPGYPSPSSPAGRAGAPLAMENFWESPGEERRLQLHRSVS
ncbi:uncharacterized protein LOC120410082 isoform X3 [Corvus cornix cornix]|uniref:uncharacterized protein LOC120410082 isoform X3 n=1 Tax=Corvus cornix cornix TaxID=932674 RepID=UPI00195126B6|nr:uncharacterized protein LOC120410082 isoform X3 [Corvus cornix cornix]